MHHLTDRYGIVNSTNLPWLLTKQESTAIREVVRKIQFPIGFASNISHILTKQGYFGGDKTHDWNTFMTV